MIDIINYEYYVLNPIGLHRKKRLDWLELWIEKADYLSNYYMKIEGKYEIIDESIDYYFALLESGINYLKKYNNYWDYSFLQHHMFSYNNFCDKNSFKEDLKERDLAEYIKYLFISSNYNISDIYKLIEKTIYNFNYELVIARLLFPSYYLYYLEKLILYDIDYDMLEKIINRSGEYEEYLKKIVNKINQYILNKIVLPF